MLASIGAGWSGPTVMCLGVLVSACSTASNVESDVVVTVTSDLAGEFAGFALAQTVVLAPRWINGDTVPPELLSRLQEVTGFPVRDVSEGRDPSFAYLAFHRPRITDREAVDVVVELLTFGPTGFHGRDWQFVLNCAETCTVVEGTAEPGWLN